MSAFETESLPTRSSRAFTTDACEQSDETARRPESGGVVVALPAMPTGHASVDLQGGALEQNLTAGTIEERRLAQEETKT